MAQTKLPAPLGDSSYWRRLLAIVHPDKGGDHELFLFLQGVRAHVDLTLRAVRLGDEAEQDQAEAALSHRR